MRAYASSRRSGLIAAGIICVLLVIVGSIICAKRKTPTVGESPTIASPWTEYSIGGISFLRDPSWIIESPEEQYGNRRTWRLSRIEGDNRDAFLIITRVRNYPSLPTQDPVQTYLADQNGINGITTAQGQAVHIAGRDGIQYSPGYIVIPIPEERGFVELSFSYTGNNPPLSQAITQLFAPILSSLTIYYDSWPQPGGYPTIVPHPSPGVLSWKQDQEAALTVHFPPTWTIEKREMDYYEGKTMVISHGNLSREGTPSVFIGSFVVYSTSGVLCGNELCPEVGEISFIVEGRPYTAVVVQKQRRDITPKPDAPLLQYYYAFQTELIHLPNRPYVTGQFTTVEEGRNIADIIASITSDSARSSPDADD